jgi:hydrogenase-4 component B
LAYHSVENIGIILIGLGFAIVAFQNGRPVWGTLAMAGGLLHVWNHGIFKALLFLGAGSVLHATGTREMSRLGGLWRQMPWTTAFFILGATAISGLPPLNGFVSEFLVYLGLFSAVGERGVAAWGAIPATVFLAMTGALALACFVKVVGVVFLGVPRTPATARAHESGRWMLGPMLVLATACIAIGVLPGIFWIGVSRAVAAWQPEWNAIAAPQALYAVGICHGMLVLLAAACVGLLFWRVRRNGLKHAVTWDCGYAQPTPRMQYTAGSFAEIITGWFGWILQPERHEHRPSGVFPKQASHSSHTPETVLEKVVRPAAEAVMVASTTVRRLQHGRLQTYILYLVMGLIGLAILAYLGVGQ